MIQSLSRLTALSIFIVLGLVLSATAQQAHPRPDLIPLSSLVSPADPLAAQDLTFDASFAREAMEYLHSPSPDLFQEMAESPAIDHIRAHARNFDYDVPKDSAEALVRSLLAPESKQSERSALCGQALSHFTQPMLADAHWVLDALAYLPGSFRYRGRLFLTFGYDIGVAFGPNASLNCTHPHFDHHPEELLYYAIHELHHVGFMTFNPPPRLDAIKSCADLLSLVEYSTQMEGMAVLAAYARRSREHALGGDPDYVALQDEQQIQSDLSKYLADYTYLQQRGNQPADSDAWKVIARMSSGNRLWYRVGAYMAQRIEAASGRDALVKLVQQGPSRFLDAYRSLSQH